MSGEPVLEASRVAKRYRDTVALDDVSLRVAAGELVALVGESGSGKTTLLRCFNAMVRPDGGRVRVAGRDVATADPVALRRSIGYVPQDGGLLPHWSVLRNAGMVPWLRGDDGERAATRALALVGLDPDRFAARHPKQLSGGQRQRVAIARALAANPAIVLLDEPFGALDAITRAELRDAFSALRRRLAITALLVTHDLAEALALADRVAVLRAGRLEQLAAPTALTASPASEYVSRLLRTAGVAHQ